MSDIQKININKFELKLADTDDPVAQKVSWEPAVAGGSNFKSQKVEFAADRITVKKTLGMTLFSFAFLLPGLGVLLIGVPYNFFNGEVGTGFFLLLWSVIFSGVGFGMLIMSKPFTFDRLRGVFFRGKRYGANPTGKKKSQGLLSEIHAIQLISERVHSSKNNYTSYELNLVLKDASRVNVLDHGKGKDVETDARRIAQFLNVPIWQASY